MKPQFLISAPSSDSGKTTITLGLMRALRKRQLNVQPFKCGPDYIDTKHHTLAAGNISINIDTFMSSKEHAIKIYNNYIQAADVSIIEGVMGLFDGSIKMQGSSAEIAEMLNVPIILIVEAKGVAYSIAPLLYGFKNFYKNINIAGVLFNKVNSESHYRFLKDACEDVGVKSLGYIPFNENISIPSRHLGLKISSDIDYETIINNASEHIEKYVDINNLLRITKKKTNELTHTVEEKNTDKIIAIAKDEAFNFAYKQNIDMLGKLGTIKYFSPLEDKKLPKADFIYFAGGYPELHLQELSSNKSMLDSIEEYHRAGGKIFAECGGMMYLGKSIINSKGIEYNMCNIFNFSSSMLNPKLKLGYRKVQYKTCEFRGHEFHYSVILNDENEQNIGEIYNARDVKQQTKIYKNKNAIASYIHFYWGEHNNLMELFK